MAKGYDPRGAILNNPTTIRRKATEIESEVKAGTMSAQEGRSRIAALNARKRELERRKKKTA